jgi:TolB-like protein
MRFVADYTSRVRHEALPLRTTVTVLVAPELAEDMKDDRPTLDVIVQGYRSALINDLRENGPIMPVEDAPEARLEVTIDEIKHKDTQLWIMTWMIAPLWIFGLPMQSVSVDMTARFKLTSAFGTVLADGTGKSHCSRLQGIYYGHDALTFGCPAQEINEQMRQQLSTNRSTILGRVERDRAARPAIVSARAPEQGSDAQGAVVAVFPINDMSSKVDRNLLDQLTEYLAVRIAEKLRFRVVPREQLRSVLADEKKSTFRPCFDQSCQIELGKAVAATRSLATTLIRVSNRCVLNATLYDLKTEAAVKAASAETTCEDSAMLDGINTLVQSLAVR